MMLKQMLRRMFAERPRTLVDICKFVVREIPQVKRVFCYLDVMLKSPWQSYLNYGLKRYRITGSVSVPVHD